MLGRLKEALKKESDPLSDIWQARCQDQKKIDARVTFFTGKERNERFQEVQKKGQLLLQGIAEIHGEETTQSLLNSLEGLSLGTQLSLLRLSQTESPISIINSLNLISDEERKDWEFPMARQDKLYRHLLEGVLEQKDGEDFERVREKVEQAGAIFDSAREDILNLCLQRGSKFISDALDYIPPNQIVPEKIDRRLDLEKRLQESPEQPIERKFVFSGYVQDVGFRGHSLECAEEWGVTTGWVRNETDGTVTLVLQGEPSRLDLIIQELEKPETRQVELQEEKNLDETERLKEFDIKIAEGWVEAGW